MWVVPGATQRYIKNKSVGVRDKTLGLVLHVQDGDGELTGWFNNPDAEASSCWQVRKDGQILQFGDPDVDKFWTQAAGNPNWGAVETEGRPSEPLTPEQIEGVAQIYAAGHLNEGWPFQITNSVDVRGLGTHAMGGKAWGGHTGCPGALRTAQRKAILTRAQQITQGDDMPLTDADAKTVWDTDLTKKGTIGGADSNESPLDILTRVARNVEAVAALTKVQADKVAAAVVAAQVAAKQPTVDVDALARAIVVQLTKEA